MSELADLDRAELVGDARDLGSASSERFYGRGARQPGGDYFSYLSRKGFRFCQPVTREREPDPVRGPMSALRRDPLFPASGAVGEQAERFVAIFRAALAVLCFRGDLGLLGEVEPEDDRDVLGLESIDNLTRFPPADDDGRGAELLCEVESAVDFVACVGLPPDRDQRRTRLVKSLAAGSKAGRWPPCSL